MKPRIFLLNDQEQSSIELFNSLNALEAYSFNFADTKYFIHVGFNPPASAEVKSVLRELPTGFYCSIGFKEGAPGKLWKFGDACGKLTELSTALPILSAPILNFEISEPTIDSLKLIQQQFTDRVFKTNINGGSDPEFGDERLSDYEFSVRLTNVFNTENIVFLSDLLKLSEAALLRFPNFGRKSLNEVTAFLGERGLTLNQPNIKFSQILDVEKNPRELVSDSVERDLTIEIERLPNERTVEILKARIGLGKQKTLQALGSEYSVTRERVRQIEARGIERILKKPNNLFQMWNTLIFEHVQNSVYPIEIETLEYIDRSFQSKNIRSADIIKYLVGLNKRGIKNYTRSLNVVEFQGKQLISEFSQQEFDEFHKLIVEIFANSSRMPLSRLKADCYRFSTAQKEKYFNLIFDYELSNSLITHSDESENIFVKYVRRSNIERAMQLLLDYINSCDGPIKTDELNNFVEKNADISARSLANALSNNDDVFPYRHGLWTTFKHIEFTEDDKRIIVERATAKLEDKAYTQLHCRDLAVELEGKLSSDLNYFAIAGILKKYSDLNYLGRSVFCAKGAQLEQRFFIHDALVNVLRANERPMRLSELLEQAREFVSIPDSYQPAIKAPIINLGHSTYALDYWDM